jgi:hypothetical protein
MRTIPRYKKRNEITGRDIAVGAGTAAAVYFIGIPLVFGILVIGLLTLNPSSAP